MTRCVFWLERVRAPRAREQLDSLRAIKARHKIVEECKIEPSWAIVYNLEVQLWSYIRREMINACKKFNLQNDE